MSGNHSNREPRHEHLVSCALRLPLVTLLDALMVCLSQPSMSGLLTSRSLIALTASLVVAFQSSCTKLAEEPEQSGESSATQAAGGTASGQGNPSGGAKQGSSAATSPAGTGSFPNEEGPAGTLTEGGSTTTAEGPACRSDQDCADPNRPACDSQSGACVRCTRSADHCKDPKAPHCGTLNGTPTCQACFRDADCGVSSGGSYCLKEQPANQEPAHRCVQCLGDEACTDPAAPRCDLQSGSYQCASCNAVLGQCPGDQSCLLMGEGTGRCTSAVIYVQESSDCQGKTGSKASPFCNLMDALKAVNKNTPTTIQLPAGESAMLGVQVPTGIQVSLVGQEDFNPQLVIDEGTHISLHGFRLRGGLLVWGGSKVRLSALEGTRVGSIELSGKSEMWMDRSVFASDGSRLGTPPIAIEDSQLHISSSVIAGHKVGSDDPERDGLALFGLRGASKLSMDHVTIVNNDLEKKAPIFRCKDRRSSVSLESSIVLGLGSSSQMRCASTQVSSNRVLSDLPVLVNEQGRLWTQSAWQSYFRNPAQNDFGLGPGYKNSKDAMRKAIRELGEWSSTQSSWDLDGEPWAPGKGFVGADQAES